MRFEQRDIWRGKVEMPTSQNRYLYCVNEPVGYYDRSGNRVDEDAGKPKKVTPGTNVKKTVPFSEDTAQSLRQEQFAIQKINSANRQLDTALRNAGVDTNNSSEATKQVVAKARQEIAQKAANGTLITSGRYSTIVTACTTVRDANLTPWERVNTEFLTTVGNYIIDFFDSNTGSIGGEFHNGILYGSGAITAGYNEVMIRGQSESKDYASRAGVFGKVSVINASGKIGLKSDDVGLFLKGVGDVLTTTLFGGVQLKDGLGFALKAKAAVLSGRATIDFEFAGWQVELGVTGDVLSAGAEVKVINNNSGEIFVASNDVYVLSGIANNNQNADWETQGSSLFDDKVSELCADESDIRVTKVRISRTRDLIITFSNNYQFQCFANSSSDVEYWRFITRSQSRHFVAYASRVKME